MIFLSPDFENAIEEEINYQLKEKIKEGWTEKVINEKVESVLKKEIPNMLVHLNNPYGEKIDKIKIRINNRELFLDPGMFVSIESLFDDYMNNETEEQEFDTDRTKKYINNIELISSKLKKHLER